MTRIIGVLAACMWFVGSLGATQNFIVRTSLGEAVLRSSCVSLGCNVSYGLGDPLGQVFLITTPDVADAAAILSSLASIAGVTSSEVDRVVYVQEDRPAVPGVLYNSTVVSYFGANVRYGYAFQPATQVIRLNDAQSTFRVQGTGLVAVIDTGVDPDHPVLRGVLVPGYDFTRAGGGTGSERYDVNQSTAAVVDGSGPLSVNANTVALLDQATAAVVGGQDHSAFGHGTMVAGVIHLVAPGVKIIPLKAFKSNGSGNISDILRAIYSAVRSKARVINMSFSTPFPSPELKRAVDYAAASGAICVASAGNNGVNALFYPAAYDNVIGVASTTNDDRRSAFSNYGKTLVWLAAPGEGVITTYPFGTFAAAWGTSFSAPFVSGTAALLVEARANLTPQKAALAIGQAKVLTPELNHGRLDVYQAIQASLLVQ